MFQFSQKIRNSVRRQHLNNSTLTAHLKCKCFALKNVLVNKSIISIDKWNNFEKDLTLSWRRPLSYRNQSTDLQNKSMDWFLYDNSLHHERVKITFPVTFFCLLNLPTTKLFLKYLYIRTVMCQFKKIEKMNYHWIPFLL